MMARAVTGTTTPLTGWPLWWRMLVIGGLWGSSFPLLRIVAVEMSPFAIACLRGGFAALAVLVFMTVTGQLQRFPRRVLIGALVLGTTNGWVPNLLTAVALNHIEAAPAALIHAATPLLVALVAIPFLAEERPGPRGAAGLLVGFLGIAVILGPAAMEGGATLIGGLLILASGVAYAAGTVYARKVKPGAAAPLALGQQMVSASVAGALAVPFAPAGSFDLSLQLWVVLALLGAFASALPLTMFLMLLQRARATDAGMVGYLQPPFAAGVAAILLGEWPELRVLVGGLIVLAGVWLATSRR
jgi:drug/metabolite transporter (DMT)-like permease